MLLLGVEGRHVLYKQRAKVGGGVGMTTDIDLLLFQRSGSVREAACVHLFVSGGRRLICVHTHTLHVHVCCDVYGWK